jgi:ribosomal protein L11 methyltransferase
VDEPIGWRVIVETSPADAELVADVLFASGALGIEERDVSDGTVALLAGMPDEDAAIRASNALDGARVEPIHDEGWADAWRAWAKPVRVGSLVVQPAWLPHEPQDDATTVLVLDPGRAFGSGAHESTRLALAEVLAHTRHGARVLDVGCGSGVLGVAAAMTAGAEVLAIDVDPHAVEVTRENAARNSVAHLVQASTRPLTSIDGAFDVVVANILAVTLREIAAELARLVAIDGVVILSGMLDEQGHAVDDAYRAAGLEPVTSASDGGWVARCFRRAPRA